MKKEDYVIYKFYIIMCTITLIIGSLFVYDSLGIQIKGQLIIILISYLPLILFLINFLIAYKNKKNKKVVNIFTGLSIFLTCILIFYYFIAIIFVVAIQSMTGVSNPIFYKHYVSGKLTEVFPKSIPNNVTNVEFFYNPPFLQGGMNHYLYYINKNMTINKFDKKYKNKAIWIGHKNEYNEKQGLLTSDLVMFEEGAYNRRTSHENDFIIYLIKGKCDDSGYCNHGEYLLAAFNEKTKEVIYKSEIW